MNFLNFYCVDNAATKKDSTDAFELRDSSKAFNVHRGCKRKWMNDGDKTRSSAGLNFQMADHR
jgi:hypothetical protein